MGRRKKNTLFAQTAVMNNQTFLMWYNYLKLIAVNRMKWTNLPETCDPRWLELMLVERGYTLFFHDEIMGFLTLPCTIGGGYNVYNIPVDRRAFAANGYNAVRRDYDSVIIYNNYMHIPDEMIIRNYAYRLYITSRAIDVNIQQQKFPYIATMPEEMRLSYENFIMKYEGNQHILMVDKSFDTDTFKVFPTQVPFVADKLEVEQHQILNQFLTFMGVENSNQDKRERLVANEVGSNGGNIEIARQFPLNARKQAVDEINSMFGLNLNVEFNSNLYSPVNKPDLVNNANKGGADSEPLYNTSQMDS